MYVPHEKKSMAYETETGWRISGRKYRCKEENEEL
jgi:hypothetical protein